jgi:hypothetical protein
MKYINLCYTVIFILFSCTKEDVVAVSKTDNMAVLKADFTVSDEIDSFSLINKTQYTGKKTLSYKWISSCDTISVLSSGDVASFDLPKLSSENKFKIKLVVKDGFLTDSITKEINLPIKSLSRQYGLGTNLIKEKSNNIAYNWYFNQINTGKFSDINCGPTTVSMAIKWANESFTKTPLEARNTYRTDGGWWYTDDINNHYIDIPNINALQNEIENGNLAILCLDMYYIRNEVSVKWHTDKFYTTSHSGWGHFIIVKGFKAFDNEIYYEVYDPYSYENRYANKVLKGIDRYYRGTDLNTAVQNWWKYAIIVSKDNNALLTAKSNKLVSPNKIIHKAGF